VRAYRVASWLSHLCLEDKLPMSVELEEQQEQSCNARRAARACGWLSKGITCCGCILFASEVALCCVVRAHAPASDS
jgi:hypothetical protein